jgi:hypothetical protein
MKARYLLPLLLFVGAFAVANQASGDSSGSRNKDGSIVTGVLTAKFDPLAGVIPFPSNLLFQGTTDLTLQVPGESAPGANPLLAQLSAMDGFSTTEKWTTTFVNRDGAPGAIDPSSVRPGVSVRVFQVTTREFVAVTSIVRELTPGVDYTAVASGNVVAVIPLQPLPEYSSFMAVLTNDIRDANGNDATPDTFYFLSKRRTPWVDENGKSTYPLIPDAQAPLLEQLRQVTLSMELNAATAGINPDDIILSWTVQTQSVSPTLGLLRSIAEPAPAQVINSGLTTAAAGGFGIADVYIGTISLPYYLGIPTAENPTAPLTDFWTAEPGAYIPPFDQFGLDPTSTNITVANPFPVLTGVETVPLIMTIPNAGSGASKPPGGWPVVIFGHGLGSNRATLLAAADGFAAAGFAAVAIDFPLHGIAADDPVFGLLSISNTPFAPFGRERTFNVDYINNATGAPGPDGIPDPSGAHALNFAEFRTSRDNVRQGIADMSVLAVSVGSIDYDGDNSPDFSPMNMGYAGLSWGGVNGTGFSALEPLVTRSALSAPAGGLLRAGEASPTFGPRIRAGLAAAGIFPGSAAFEQYLTIGQTVVDSADPINWIKPLAMGKPVLIHQIIGDTVLPNAVPGAPLSGTEPMIRSGGLLSYSSSQMNADGLRAAGRFLPPAEHSSWLNPGPSPEATAEMQGQFVSFLGSGGTAISVVNDMLMVPVIEPGDLQINPPMLRPIEDKKKDKPGSGGWQPVLQSRGQVVKSGEQFND